MADSSFDIVSKIDRQEVDNALGQTAREIATRFDFKGTGASIEWKGEHAIEITASADDRASAVLSVFQDKLIKRNQSLKILDASEPRPSGQVSGVHSPRAGRERAGPAQQHAGAGNRRSGRLTVEQAIRARHSVKHFSDRAVTREDVEALLELGVQAPNHRMTEPWHFLVAGDEAKHALARVLGRRKSSKVTDPEAARLVREKVERNTMALPALVVVTLERNDDPEIREEDFAAGWMAIQNIALAAVARGLGTHIKTGAVMDDAELRAAWRVPDGRRIIAMIELGEPAGEPRATEREPATGRTTWLP